MCLFMNTSSRASLFLVYVFLLILVSVPISVRAETAYDAEALEVSFSTYADTYYSYNLNSLPTRNRPYTTQPLYNEELALNLAYVEIKIDSPNLRGRFALQHGSSVISNYASEPELFWRYIQEANAGYQIGEGLWIDAGIFLSHIGLESWISRDNWTYTRSLIADYSPYYQTGAKLAYEVSKEMSLSLHLINGWQNISDDRNPAFGSQISYNPTCTTQITYNTFLGNEGGYRLFNNLIAKQRISESFELAASFDFGFQMRKEEDDTATWHGWAAIAQYKVLPKMRIAGRIERYVDPHQVIVTSMNENHIAATGFSVNVDFDLSSSLLWRTEYRVLTANSSVFPRENGFNDSENFVVTSLAYTWDY
jgi:hypothetical protein